MTVADGRRPHIGRTFSAFLGYTLCKIITYKKKYFVDIQLVGRGRLWHFHF